MSQPATGSQVLRIPALTRVEGETALRLRIDDGTVTEARLSIYEPPRFFEAFLRGRAHTEPRTSPPASAGSARSPTS